jgi:hypothetical protein
LVTGRHETGSYYTPKPVVEFMCRQALKHYLAQETDLPETILEDLVENHSVENLSPAQANDIIRVLDTIKICDPACGSGAYLVTMLHELVAIYRTLYSEKLNDPQKDYDLKLRIIERNLYGVDIDPFAVHIARLRLWLTLIVDSEETDWRRVKPLPNLDFKIEIGDSLTAPNPQAMPDLFRSVLIQHADRLAQLKGKYLRAYGEEKRRLERQIKDEESQLRDALRDSPAPQGALDWRIAFAEVFAEKQGFDIVLANPPYVRQELIPEAYKRFLSHPHRSEFRRRSASSRIQFSVPSLQPKPEPATRLFSREFHVKLSSGSKNPAHLAGKRIGRDLRGLKKPCFAGADGN